MSFQWGKIEKLFVLGSSRGTRGVQSEMEYAKEAGIPIEVVNEQGEPIE